ncbi:MAG: ABC transporter permease [Chloroflexota bacterium]
MRAYIIKRLLLAIPTTLLLTLMVFALTRILPGDVAQLILGGGESPQIGTVGIETVRRELGLDSPLPIQYLQWLWDLLRGDLGLSLFTRTPVLGEILHRLPLTMQLGVMATGLGVFVGVPIGIICAIYRNSWLDYTLRFWSIFFLSAPSFWLGLMFLLAVVRFLDWSPPMGYNLLWQHPKDNLLQLAWPALILGSHSIAVYARYSRSQMLEVIREDYIRTARAKGLAEMTIIMRHALKNALIPIVTIMGTGLGHMLAGSVIMEQIFSIPGVGRYFLEAIKIHDFTVIQGLVAIISISFVFINLAVDLVYGWLDPRISYA